MQNVSLQKATQLTGKSESTIRRDVKSGKVSAARDDRGHIRFDIAELQRAYGELKSSGDDDKATENSNGQAMTGHDSAEIIAIKDNQITDLHAQIARAELREDALTAEKSKLLELVSRMQEQTDRLTLTGEVEKKSHWITRFLGTG